ncbi:MAG: sialate O-acetylesterase [Verrucomicrobiota bacterium]
MKAVIAGLVLGACVSAQAENQAVVLGDPANPPSDKSKFKIFLLIGQSNMAGRAPITPEDSQSDPRVLVLNKMDKWYCQGEPIHFDKPPACGVGPGFTFAKLLADQEPGITVGLVPCAYGGTTVEQWSPNSMETLFYKPFNLYNNAIRRTRIALESGTLSGILWHQGESDAAQLDKLQQAEKSGKVDPSLAPYAVPYATRLAKLVAQLRTDLNAPAVPFVAGEIRIPLSFNSQINLIPASIPNSAVVSIKGLHGNNGLHFDNAEQKEIARRYLTEYLKLQQKLTSPRN